MGDQQQQQQPSTSGITNITESQDNMNVMASINASSTAATTTAVTTTTMDQSGCHIDDEFLNTGRTGRRNALGDILDENSAYLTTAELPDQLSSLSFESSGGDQSCSLQSTPSTSNCHQSSSSSS
ncbi:uncharacterized protein LOC113790397 isoform X2 [Dermatophagoides pteronyssinus]|uniref:Uncharacterized protein LOC113790397 isoform X2 n=1 Tax=Dermatophagoides pteronyssinus TaxID=6956 RepID=A0A6P6XSP5_DERPT|nr:uncharacterized protein LOC113790397 isoform X2 [Dermatophagoides pteronyssinus]